MLPNPLLPDQLPKPQFRCVVACGFGVDLFPLVEPSSKPLTAARSQLDGPQQQQDAQVQAQASHAQTKPLLPVAGKKMIDWVLERVEQAGVYGAPRTAPLSGCAPQLLTFLVHTEILVLAPESIARPVGHHLRARRLAAAAAAAGSSSAAAVPPTAKVELEEVPEHVAAKNVVRVLMWAVENNLITVSLRLPNATKPSPPGPPG